jgi:hypothetical protein
MQQHLVIDNDDNEIITNPLGFDPKAEQRQPGRAVGRTQ